MAWVPRGSFLKPRLKAIQRKVGEIGIAPCEWQLQLTRSTSGPETQMIRMLQAPDAFPESEAAVTRLRTTVAIYAEGTEPIDEILTISFFSTEVFHGVSFLVEFGEQGSCRRVQGFDARKLIESLVRRLYRMVDDCLSTAGWCSTDIAISDAVGLLL